MRVKFVDAPPSNKLTET